MSEIDLDLLQEDNRLPEAIEALVEHVFAQTSPVKVELPVQIVAVGTSAGIAEQPGDASHGPEPGRSSEHLRRQPDHRLLAMVAGVVLTVLSVSGLIGLLQAQVESSQAGDQTSDPADSANSKTVDAGLQDGVLVIQEPDAIDLQPVIEQSSQSRLRVVSAPATTAGFAELPAGWSTESESSSVWAHPIEQGTWGYTHITALTGPDDVRATVVAHGVWTGSVGVNRTQARDVFDLLQSGQIVSETWRPNEQVVIEVLAAPPSTGSELSDSELRVLLDAAARDIRTSLTLVTRDLPGQVRDLSGGVHRRQATPLLAGRIGPDEVHWAVSKRQSLSPTILRIGSDADRRILASSTNMELALPAAEPTEFDVAASEVPGGRILFGTAPMSAETVRLIVRNGDGSSTEILIPVVSIADNERPLFAVPVDDRLDPLSVDFLSGAGAVVETIDVSGLAPAVTRMVSSEP